MLVSEILTITKKTKGSNDKKSFLRSHTDNQILKDALRYGNDPFMPFHVVKVPKVVNRTPGNSEHDRWERFFEAASRCLQREVTGNAAVSLLHDALSSATAEEDAWMRKILKKHLAIGASTKTINSVFPGLIPVFEVSLAQKFDAKRLMKLGSAKRSLSVAVEPKLDGIRCISIVRGGSVTMLARSGKAITNFEDTIGAELSALPEGVYDGEIMSSDFTALMRQAYRKDDVDTSDTYLSLFDHLSLDEWDRGEGFVRCETRYETLQSFVPRDAKHIKVIDRYLVDASHEAISELHAKFVAEGYEGAMVKDLDAPYKFGRGYEVMKMKAFHDADLEVVGLIEGTGKHSGKLGSFVVVYQGVEVHVGSGLSDELREAIWARPDDFTGRTIEVRYQEVTPDGSLRFPTFVCFRNDRD